MASLSCILDSAQSQCQILGWWRNGLSRLFWKVCLSTVAYHLCAVKLIFTLGGVRAIISKGWSSRMSKNNDAEVEYPPECYPLDKVPHECVPHWFSFLGTTAHRGNSWLFPQIDVAVHHGGAGTTGASLRGMLSLIPICDCCWLNCGNSGNPNFD